MAQLKKGLQKLTETEKKIESIFAIKKIMPGDVGKILNDKEIKLFEEIITKKVNETKGDERDKFLDQIDEILTTDIKNQLWENNHFKITQSMSKLIDEYGKMPTKNHIAADSGLSRQTIHKHLKTYPEHPLYSEQLRQFEFMADRILAKVIKSAAQGDIKAARLFFDMMSNFSNKAVINTTINTQNNYLQINQTKLSQAIIKKLSVDQINQIEAVLKSVPNLICNS